MKICIECGVEKQLTDFRIARSGRTKYRRCKKCMYKRHWAWNKQNPISIMLQSARHRAKRDGLAFSLDKSDIVIPEVCPVLGIKLAAGDRHNHDYAPTIERIEPELGYIPGNIAVISYRANRIRNDATLEELERVLRFYQSRKEEAWKSLFRERALDPSAPNLDDSDLK
jgi:hypothetical protein